MAVGSALATCWAWCALQRLSALTSPPTCASALKGASRTRSPGRFAPLLRSPHSQGCALAFALHMICLSRNSSALSFPALAIGEFSRSEWIFAFCSNLMCWMPAAGKRGCNSGLQGA